MKKIIDKIDDSDKDKILTSFYLLPTTLEKMDDLLFYVKKRLPIEKRRKLSKSIFYETCLRIVIEEYNAKGEESSVWKSIRELMLDN